MRTNNRNKNNGLRSPLTGTWYVVGVVSLADGSYISAPQITQNPANYANEVKSFYRGHPEMSVSQFPKDYAIFANEIGVVSSAMVFEFPESVIGDVKEV